MRDKNQVIKEKLKSFWSIFIIILLFFFNSENPAYGDNNEWIRISKTPARIQYLDRNSIRNKDKVEIKIVTKYVEINPNTSRKIGETVYTMRINCLTNKLKDISVNGKKNLSAKWENPNEDKLINDVISDSCKNV